MSRLSKITLTIAIMVSAGVVGYVHYKQTSDRDKLHEGVVRDMLRQQKRKVENTYVLQQQIEKTKQLKANEADHVAENARTFDMDKKSNTINSDTEEKYHQVFETSQQSESEHNAFIDKPNFQSNKDEV